MYFLYTWDAIANDKYAVINNFTLSEQPQILFGADILDSNKAVSAGSNPLKKSDKTDVSPKEDNAVQKMIKRTEEIPKHSY